MKLISSSEAVAFLSQAAPRPWVQRMLRWMAFDEGLRAYTRMGKVQPHVSVIEMTAQLMESAGERSGPKMDALIRQEYSEEIADRLVGRDPFSRFDDEPFTWNEGGEPLLIDTGFFLYADEIDWETGTIRVDYIPHGPEIEIFFEESRLLQTEFERANFEAVLEGLSFEASAIELLLPSFTLGRTTGFTARHTDRGGQIGRPAKWDWEGAMAHVIALAQHPDGLPTGPGAQARVEELITGWFEREVQDAPAPSQVRQRAARIMRMIETPENR